MREPDTSGRPVRLTIGIKALNEEANIAACIERALAIAAMHRGDVVLADSGSTDRTIAIALQYPIRIAQLAHPAERCCGAGAQLAFQQARGDYFWLIDGDMIASTEFAERGITFLETNRSYAGVGGSVREMNLDNADFQIRAQSLESDHHRRPGLVDRLDGGGIYRTAAIAECSYFADRNLHTFEEFDLAMRLSSRGWNLARIDCEAVRHYGYRMGGYRLLWHRMRSGYTTGVGEILRAAWNHRNLPKVIRELEHVPFSMAVVVWWFLSVTALATAPLLALPLLLLPVAYLCFRRRSIRLGFYSFLTWNIMAGGMIRGLLRKRMSPYQPLATRSIRSDDGENGVLSSASPSALWGSNSVDVAEASSCAS